MVTQESKSFLLGNAALVVWGNVNSNEIDEPALNDWWTNEHLPERLSIPGFNRARRYYSYNGLDKNTKYLTLYETSNLDVLTSPAYMEKLNNPTKGTEQHIPTLATMQRSACRLVHSETRQELQSCGTGVGATLAMVVLSLPSSHGYVGTAQDLLTKHFSEMQQSNKSAMNLIILEEDVAATEPGSSSQSYLNVKLKPKDSGDRKKLIILFEFSSPARVFDGHVEKSVTPLVDDLVAQNRKTEVESFDVYEFMCSVRAYA